MSKEFVEDGIKKLLAIETLEYLDKNWLAYGDKYRNEQKQELLREMQFSLNKM